MNQYIELSKEFKKNNSQEIIAKLYDFMTLLERNDDKENKMILTFVYTLLGFHKKSYDLYMKIYDPNDRKQISKVFELEQMSKSHGDNFTIKLKKAKIIENTIFEIKDFTEKNVDDNWKKYEAKKECIIFNQIFNNEPLEIIIQKNNELSKYITEINKYLNWLGGKCKKELIKYYNKNMGMEEEASDEWYEELEIYSVSITINELGKISADISCGDNYFEDHILDIEMDENKIFSINYDG